MASSRQRDWAKSLSRLGYTFLMGTRQRPAIAGRALAWRIGIAFAVVIPVAVAIDYWLDARGIGRLNVSAPAWLKVTLAVAFFGGPALLWIGGLTRQRIWPRPRQEASEHSD